ncbi:hypothetical protein ATANTOWER_028530, partial [Ataeniobius toweri]|nr:hypothetical protein [Ataeniobius toweri]
MVLFQPSCVVCISNVISKSPGNSLFGFQRSIPSEFNKIRLDENNYQIWRDVGLAVLKEPSMKVNVAKINCPLLLVNGCDDQNWCAVETADE